MPVTRTRARKSRMSVDVAGVHILRHTFCSHLAMRGAPARAIQELAGQQDLSTTPGLAAGREGGPAPNYGRRRIGQGGHLEPGNFVTVRNRPRKPTVDGGLPLRVQPCTNTGASSGSAPATGFSSSVPNGSAIVAGAPRMADSPSKTSDSGLLRSGETTGSPRQQPS